MHPKLGLPASPLGGFSGGAIMTVYNGLGNPIEQAVLGQVRLATGVSRRLSLAKKTILISGFLLFR